MTIKVKIKKSAPLPPKVWVLKIWHKHGEDTYVCSTKREAKRLLLHFVEQWWDEVEDEIGNQSDGEPYVPESAGEKIEAYFEQKQDNEGYTIEEHDVAGVQFVQTIAVALASGQQLLGEKLISALAIIRDMKMGYQWEELGFNSPADMQDWWGSVLELLKAQGFTNLDEEYLDVKF